MGRIGRHAPSLCERIILCQRLNLGLRPPSDNHPPYIIGSLNQPNLFSMAVTYQLCHVYCIGGRSICGVGLVPIDRVGIGVHSCGDRDCTNKATDRPSSMIRVLALSRVACFRPPCHSLSGCHRDLSCSHRAHKHRSQGKSLTRWHPTSTLWEQDIESFRSLLSGTPQSACAPECI